MLWRDLFRRGLTGGKLSVGKGCAKARVEARSSPKGKGGKRDCTTLSEPLAMAKEVMQTQ